MNESKLRRTFSKFHVSLIGLQSLVKIVIAVEGLTHSLVAVLETTFPPKANAFVEWLHFQLNITQLKRRIKQTSIKGGVLYLNMFRLRCDTRAP